MMWRDIKTFQHKVTEVEKPVAMPNLGHASCASHQDILEKKNFSEPVTFAMLQQCPDDLDTVFWSS